jgi:hypothetical protein
MRHFLMAICLLTNGESFCQNIGFGTSSPEARLHILTNSWIKTIFENAPGQPRGYIGSDQNGTITFAANAFWTGSAWSYPNSGSSMYMLMHRVNNRFEFRVRPEGGSEQTAMVINTAGRVGIGTTAPQQVLSIAGGLNIDQQNLNAGTTANMLSFGGFSGEGIGSKRTEGPGRYGLDFYTSSTQRMHIAGNGNIGVGTNIPQALLDIAVGVNRSFRFKNDVIPTLEIASSNNNDALAGTMRLRNAIEIFPSSDGLRAGKLDVRNGAGIPTITLNGSTGIIQANSIQASSVNVTSVIASGGIAGQSLYAPNMPAYGEKINQNVSVVLQNGGSLDAILIDATIEVPAAGILLIKASIDGAVDRVSTPPGWPAGHTIEFKLDQYTTGNAYITTLYKLLPMNFLSNPTIEHQFLIGSPGNFRFKYKIYAKDASINSTILARPAIRFIFIPNTLTVQ